MASPLLLTDGYKFSMAEAGWPLRRETFYYSHRKGGLQVVPFDLEAELKRVLPEERPGDWEHLAAQEYDMGSAVKAALRSKELRVQALPKNAVFSDREPVFSVTGPSSLVSWLEPLVLQWNYRIQVASLALFRPGELAAAVETVTCEAQRQLVLATLDAVGVQAPPIAVDSEGYVARVRAQVAELAQILGSPLRLFEVGLRAASCPEQHLLALEGGKQAGLARTSSVYGAQQKGMTPVGTMGHEHIQRYGSDEAAFRAMVERRYQRSSFLLDTFDTITSGIPTAFEIITERSRFSGTLDQRSWSEAEDAPRRSDQGTERSRFSGTLDQRSWSEAEDAPRRSDQGPERPGQWDSIRYDSGDKEAQYRFAAAEAKRLGIRPVQILEDSFDAALTRRFEALREEVGWRPEEQVYGYGGYIVAQTSGSPLTRDRVAAVFKLTQTGKRATMKFGNESGGGKQSVPGRPVLFRRSAGASGPFGIVGQEGEAPPQGYTLLTGAPALERAPVEEARAVAEADRRLALSPATQALVDELSKWRS